MIFLGAPDTYFAATQAEANALAQTALQDFVDSQILSGDLTCVPNTDPITQAIIDRPCGALIGNESDFNDLIVSIGSTIYGKMMVGWSAYKLLRQVGGAGGCVKMCDIAGENAKPTPEYWDVALNSSSGIPSPAPGVDNITVSNANFNNKPSLLIAGDVTIGRMWFELLTSTQVLPQPFEVFLVYKFDGLTNSPKAEDQRFRPFWDSNVTRSHINWDENAPGPGMYQYAGAGLANMTGFPTPTLNLPSVVWGLFNGASSTFQRFSSAGTISSGTANPGTGGFGGTSFKVGALYTASPLAILGDLAFFGVTSSLTAPERAQMIAALRTHYGI
ncbi:MAG: hypothetical protein ACOYD4_03915 [Solirubrobacterales bacterium]